MPWRPVLRFKYINILWLLLTPLLLNAQGDIDRQLNQTRSSLDNLKNEINSIRSKIDNAHRNEESLLKQIDLIDKEAALVARTKGLLEQESRLLQKKVRQTTQELKEARHRQKELQDLYARRAVYAYKHGKIRNLELLLTSQSLNQAYIRYRYFKLIAEHDERTIRDIIKKKKRIAALKESLKKDLRRKQQILIDKKREERKYLTRKKEKATLLKKIRWSQSTYSKQLASKEEQKKNLIAMILELERKRRLSAEDTSTPEVVEFKFDDFRKAKGKLPWPVKGNVVTKYGKQRDKQSRTYTKNTDIEIKSPLGTQVHCVFKGIVRVITYLPGYGNTLIIDHGKGYYTVYSHLDEIYVQKDEGVRTNQVIATVGDSGSLAGTKLQFGIYGKQKTYNPETWLR